MSPAAMSDILPLVEAAPAHPNGWRCALRVMGQSEARQLAVLLRPTHLISIRAPTSRYLGVPDFPEPDHLSLVFDDTLDVSASETMRQALALGLDFVHRLPSDARLLVHCAAGVSRSTALTLAILARYAAAEQAGALLHRVRRTAVPNLLMAAEADRMLNAGGAVLAVAKRFPCRSWDEW